MKTSRLIAALALAAAAPAAYAQSAGKWVHTIETETYDRGLLGQPDLVTRLDYDERGNVKLRLEQGMVVDSIVSRYDDLDRLEYRADYRGTDPANLYFYTYDEWEYDPVIEDLPVWHVGHQHVDEEWTIYIAEKLGILRDDEGQILRVGDYIPADVDGLPDLPKSYVKTFANTDGRLSAYRKESYMIDPVTDEAFLRLDEEWTAIEWERYAGQVLDPNACFKGPNRISKAHVFDDYYGYDYDLSVTYGAAHPDDFEAVIDIPSIGQRKVHTLVFTDENGSFEETFRTYRIDESGAAVLSFVERATETYDAHHNLTLQERALTADAADPEKVTTRQGKRWVYSYDDRYDDWTRRAEELYNQSYVDGEDGYYERICSIVRSDWKLLPTPDGVKSVRTDEAASGCGQTPRADARTYNLAGQPTAPLRGFSISAGRKSIR